MCKFEGRVIFCKRDIQPRDISAKVPINSIQKSTHHVATSEATIAATYAATIEATIEAISEATIEATSEAISAATYAATIEAISEATSYCKCLYVTVYP